MDFLDWRVLIGVGVFIAGWLLGRVDMDQVVARARSVPARINEGIVSLLRADRTAAAEAFIAVATPLERANAELHFVAGELFRLQGNHEAAIRVHKRLLAESELGAKTHSRACYELGLDYMNSGFLDLAQACFSQMGDTEHSDASVKHLFNLYLCSRNWRAAIESEKRLAWQSDTTELRRHILAQLHCEWAAEEAPARRAELLEKALRCNPVCVRAWLMQAELALERDDAPAALAALVPLNNHPASMSLAADLVVRAHRAAGNQDAGEKTLRDAFTSRPSLLLFANAYDALARARGHASLAEFTALGLRRLRGPLPVAKWLETARRGTSGTTREQFEILHEALGFQQAKYRCRDCDYASRNHYWQCPACRGWETMLEGDQELA